jgi:hypothetical protein
MRTKVLLGLAAIAASALTSMAQSNVYSLNVVGYYNTPIGVGPTGKRMIANQLNTTNNTIGSLFTGVPEGSQFFKFNGGFSAYAYGPDDNGFDNWAPDGNATLNPGEGGFFQSPVLTTLTFVGEVLQGSLTNTIPSAPPGTAHKVISSSMVPQSAGITSVLGLPADPGDQLYQFAGGYTAYAYGPDDNGFNNWAPVEPAPGVGEAFFYLKVDGGPSTQWVRNFTVQ